MAISARRFPPAGRTVRVGELNDEGKAVGGDRYVFPTSLPPLSDADLPPNYPAKFRAQS